MRQKGDRKREITLDLAWRIAFDSMSYQVLGNEAHTPEFLAEARLIIHGISKREWMPEALTLIRENPYYGHHRLAEDAATIFINRKMNTTGLRVTFGGDL